MIQHITRTLFSGISSRCLVNRISNFRCVGIRKCFDLLSKSTSQRLIHNSSIIASPDANKDLSNDPIVKEWLKQVRSDLGHQEKIDEEDINETFPKLHEEAEIDKVQDEYEEFDDEDDNPIEYDEVHEKVHPIPFKRGETGIFDLDELVTLLDEENAKNLVAIKIPEHHHYVDYMVIVSGRSTRHIRAMAEYIKWMAKRKKDVKDDFVKIEGLNTTDWIAMDLGNIVVHMFLPETRKMYDLETLWTVGAEFDDSKQPNSDPLSYLYGNHLETIRENDNLERIGENDNLETIPENYIIETEKIEPTNSFQDAEKSTPSLDDNDDGYSMESSKWNTDVKDFYKDDR